MNDVVPKVRRDLTLVVMVSMKQGNMEQGKESLLTDETRRSDDENSFIVIKISHWNMIG